MKPIKQTMNKHKHKRISVLISENARICSSTLEKAIGLMFGKEKSDFCIIFPFDKPEKVSLHMMFVFYPIDVVILDSEHRVIETASMFPFSFFTSKSKAKYVIELPHRKCKAAGIAKGSMLSWTGSKLFLEKKRL